MCFSCNYERPFSKINKFPPFGMLMPGRSATPENYRFGFNGQEMSNELKGVGNSNTAEFWEYDTRLGRRWNLDPKPSSAISSFSVFANNPIFYNDPHGDTLRGSTQTDAEKIIAEMQNIFGKHNAIFEKYFNLKSDGMTFEKIKSVRDFNKWLNGKGEYKGKGSGFTKEQIALANGLMKTINSGFNIEVTFDEGGSAFKPIDKFHGIAYVGSDEGSRQFLDNSGNLRNYSSTQLFVHEVLGEAYTSATFGDLKIFDDMNTEYMSGRLKGAKLKIFREKELQVIQIENLYNRMNGYLRAATPGLPGYHNLDPNDLSKVGLSPPNFSSSFYSEGDWTWYRK